MLDLRTAHYFVVLGEELHYGRAAERLNMSQSPLSQAIIRLEREVGVPLLERSTRRVALTSAGEAFLTECRALLQHAETVAQTPRLIAAGASSRLTVGAVASAFAWLLPGALAELIAVEPSVSVEIREIDSDEIGESLRQGLIDVGLGRLATSVRGVATEVLVRDEFVALLPVSHSRAFEDGAIDLIDLADDPWVWLPREISPDYHDAMTSACRSAGFRVSPRHLVRSIASQIALVNTGEGVTIIPGMAADELPDGVVIRRLEGDHRAVLLSASTRTAPTATESLFLECVNSVVARSGHDGRIA